MTTPSSLLDLSPVIPVVTIDDPADAPDLARALYAGGIGVIELTLRTPSALESLTRIANEVPEIVLGAGTVLTPDQAAEAVARGAAFLVSPGLSPKLLEHLVALPVPVLPGVATVGEMMTALEHGLNELKFFPAGAAGGPAFLKAVAAPLPQVRFCPTGGVSRANMADYLSLPNVGCVGGSWLTPADAVTARDWARITDLSRDAVSAIN